MLKVRPSRTLPSHDLAEANNGPIVWPTLASSVVHTQIDDGLHSEKERNGDMHNLRAQPSQNGFPETSTRLHVSARP
jgi:hypothetical protein